MKTRIISAAVMILLVSAVIAVSCFYPVVLTVFLALVSVVATYEMLHSAAGISDRLSLAGAAVYSAGAIFAYRIANQTAPVFAVIYFLFSVVMVLKNHKSFGLKEIFAVTGMPLLISYAFCCLEGTLNHQNGIYFLLMLLNFSCICDGGAYFVGVTLGKTKLCPEISPKKTVEGAVGGIAASLVGTVIIALCFGYEGRIVQLLLLTVPLSVLGMLGDLFASAVKRAAGIKDYGNLIPGHGGVLDRLDSILMIAPLMFVLITAGII